MVGEDLRAVMRRVPTGVAVVTIDAAGQRVGLTVASLVAHSLDPPLVGFSVSRQAALHELVRESDTFGVSLLADGQEHLAQHFARGVPPIAMWAGVEVEPGEGPALLSGALGWLRGRVVVETPVGTHTVFTGEVLEALAGPGSVPLVRVDGEYRAL